MRIISLVPSLTETLYELGIGDQIVGVTRYCVLPVEAKQKAQVGGTKDPDLHAITEMKPDLVIMDRDENLMEHAEFLKEQGIRLFVVHVRTISDVEQMMTEIGETFSVRKPAERMRKAIHEFASFERPVDMKTLILIWRRPYMTVNEATYVSEICRFCGLDNAFGSYSNRYPELSDEDIKKKNPEVVLFPDEPYPFQQQHLKEFRKLYPELQAVREHRLVSLKGIYLTWHGFGTLRAMRELPAVLEGLR